MDFSRVIEKLLVKNQALTVFTLRESDFSQIDEVDTFIICQMKG